MDILANIPVALAEMSGGGSTFTTLLTEDITKAFSNAVTLIQGDITKMLVLALPAGLAIFGLSFAVRKGVRFFQSLAN